MGLFSMDGMMGDIGVNARIFLDIANGKDEVEKWRGIGCRRGGMESAGRGRNAGGGGSGGGAGGDDDLGGTEELVAHPVAAAGLGEDGALGDVGGRHVGDGLVEVGVEGLAFGIDGDDAGLLQSAFQLPLYQAEAFEEGFRGVGLDAVGEAEFEIVEGWEQVLEQLFVGKDGPILAFAVDALAVVVEIGLEAEQAILEDLFGTGCFFGGGSLRGGGVLIFDGGVGWHVLGGCFGGGSGFFPDRVAGGVLFFGGGWLFVRMAVFLHVEILFTCHPAKIRALDRNVKSAWRGISGGLKRDCPPASEKGQWGDSGGKGENGLAWGEREE